MEWLKVSGSCVMLSFGLNRCSRKDFREGGGAASLFLLSSSLKEINPVFPAPKCLNPVSRLQAVLSREGWWFLVPLSTAGPWCCIITSAALNRSRWGEAGFYLKPGLWMHPWKHACIPPCASAGVQTCDSSQLSHSTTRIRFWLFSNLDSLKCWG